MLSADEVDDPIEGLQLTCETDLVHGYGIIAQFRGGDLLRAEDAVVCLIQTRILLNGAFSRGFARSPRGRKRRLG